MASSPAFAQASSRSPPPVRRLAFLAVGAFVSFIFIGTIDPESEWLIHVEFYVGLLSGRFVHRVRRHSILPYLDRPYLVVCQIVAG